MIVAELNSVRDGVTFIGRAFSGTNFLTLAAVSKQINTIQIYNIQPYAPEAAFHVCVHYVLSTFQIHASKASLEPAQTNILHSM